MARRGDLRSVVMLIVAMWVAAPARTQACNCSDGQICGKGSVGNPFRCCHVDHDPCVTPGDPCPTTRCDPSPACCILFSCTGGEQCSSATDTCVTFRSTCDGGIDAHDASVPISTESGPPTDASGSDAASRDGRATDVDGALGGRGAGGTSSSQGGTVASGTGGAATGGDGTVARAAGGESLDGSVGSDLRGTGHTDASGCGCHAASTAANGRSAAWQLLAAALVGRVRRRRVRGAEDPDERSDA